MKKRIIKIKNEKDREVISDISPFGLVEWVCTNVMEHLSPLIMILNDEESLKRTHLLKITLDNYKLQIDNLKRGFFSFNLQNYIRYVEPIKINMPCKNVNGVEIIEKSYFDQDSKIIIPMEYFEFEYAEESKIGIGTLEDYKSWFQELYDLAKYADEKEKIIEIFTSS